MLYFEEINTRLCFCLEKMPLSFPCAASEQSPHPTNGTPILYHLLVIRLSLRTLPLAPARPCPPTRSPSKALLLSPHTPPPPSLSTRYSEKQLCEPAPTLSCYFAESAPNLVLDFKEASSCSSPVKTSDFIQKISKLDLRPRQRRNGSKNTSLEINVHFCKSTGILPLISTT